MSSLTQHEAEQRAGRVSVGGYQIALDLRDAESSDTFGSTTTVRFATRAGSAAGGFVDVSPTRLRSAVLDGRDVTAALADRRLHLDPLADGEHLLVVDADMTYSRDGEGLHRHVDPADGRTYLYAMSFLDAAPRWFACFDQPDLKAPIALDVRCPPDWSVAGNGPATEVAPGHWQVAAGHPVATYATTVVAGPYHQVRDEHDGIPLVIHARRSLAEHVDRDAAELFAHTRHCFDALHELFGVRYPWGEYHQAFVPEFNAGAMENPGCVTLRDEMIFRSRASAAERDDRKVTIAHEMAHMWFGDLVTMRWWDDLWLNESFAEYLGHRATGEHTWASFGIERKSWGYRADRRPTTHPVAGNGAPDAATALSAFDGISYAKGASLLRQLAARLGDDAFLGGLRRYVRTHAHGNAELGDLLAAWRDAGGDVDDWAAAWLRSTGVDTLAIEGDRLVRIGDAGEAARPHTVTVASLDDGRSARVTLTGDSVRHGLGADAVLLADAHDESWAKIVLPDLDRLAEVLPGLADARSRVVVWNNVVLAVADAELDPERAAAFVTRALPVEPHDAVVRQVSEWFLDVLTASYLPHADLPRLLAPFSAAATAAAEATRGEGRQLSLFRAAVRASSDAVSLRASLAGDLPDGIELDPDLRWTLLRRLAELGRLDEAELAAEAERDDTTRGAVHAAWCRAARPDPATKAEVWTALMTDAGRPNHELYALADGFWRPGQQPITDPFVARYFAELPHAAGLRSGWVAARLTQLVYPSTAVSATTLGAADRLLARDVLPSGVRRAVADSADDQRRALAARTRFPL